MVSLVELPVRIDTFEGFESEDGSCVEAQSKRGECGAKVVFGLAFGIKAVLQEIKQKYAFFALRTLLSDHIYANAHR